MPMRVTSRNRHYLEPKVKTLEALPGKSGLPVYSLPAVGWNAEPVCRD